MLIEQKLYTADELWEMAGDGKRRELVRGEIIELMPTGDEHTILGIEVARLLGNHVAAIGRPGYVTGESGGYKLEQNPDTVRAPDVGYISKERAAKLTGKYFRSAPEFAVEIMSPNDTADEIQAKVLQYFATGARLVWVIYPRTRTVVVHTSSDESHTYNITGILDGGDVLPGFKLAVRDIFAVLDE
ncbi:MAG: Uma2 family endonuclease [Anaerolineae bacterium]